MTCIPARTAAASSMSPTSRDLVLIVDGASRGNPGPSAIGVVIKDAHGKVLREIGEYIGEFTNNVAEYRALLRVLEEAKEMGAGATRSEALEMARDEVIERIRELRPQGKGLPKEERIRLRLTGDNVQ